MGERPLASERIVNISNELAALGALRREAHWLAGRPYDVVYMDCLSSDFGGKALRQLRP
jgi:hypothetical protein